MDWTGIATALVGSLILGYFGFVVRVEARLTKIETFNEMFWKVLEPHLANIIHSPEHSTRDQLVDGLVHGHLTREELQEVIPLLEASIADSNTDGKKIASVFLLARAKTLLSFMEAKKKWRLF
jgi:Trk K+ transport system NAD-binding subunit